MHTNQTFLRLQKEISLMQGFKAATLNAGGGSGLSVIKEAFPHHAFPLSAVHEFICASPEDAAASSGFVCGIVSSLMNKEGLAVWIGSQGTVYPYALAGFGIQPERIFFIEPRNEKEKCWTIEEALRCEGLRVVIADVRELSFTNSRRLQLAVEQSGVTGFLLRRKVKSILTCAVTQWQVKPIICESGNDLPGVGFPQWNVELLKVRNGKPGRWYMEWKAGEFRRIQANLPAAIPVKKVV